MKIVLCIKQVPDTSDIKWTENNTIQREGLESIMNPYDVYAMEAALKLKNITEAHQTPQVSTINLAGSVTFKLKNRLASSYRLKEGECVIEQGVDYIIVSNNLEDKDLILKRLKKMS